MSKLTATQVGALLGVTSYTVKRWYNWYENLTIDNINKYIKESNMPILPEYETVGNTNWRFWNEEDVEQLRKFKEWVPHTKRGIFQKGN